MSGRQTVRDADTGLQTCVHVGDLKELAERLRASDDSCMYFGCWDGPECDGCPADDSPYDCSGAMAHDAADRIDAAITRGVFAGGILDATDEPKVSGCPEARFTLRHDALEAFEWVMEHGGLEVMRRELPVISYRASLVGSVYDALEIDPDEPGASMLLSSEVKRLREDHDALLWMDEHGGLGQVKMDYAMGEGFADLADRVAAKLGVNVEGLDAQDSEPVIMDAIDRRLVPDGMSWPRFEDGVLVRFGDEAARWGKTFDVGSVTLYHDGSFSLNFNAYSKGQRVERPEADSWERLEADAALAVDKYRERYGLEKRDDLTWPQHVRADLVRRARALAERSAE